MIDGWFMRKRIYSLRTFDYSGPEIRRYCGKHLRDGDSLYRIFYYDTPPLQAKAHNPITKEFIDFSKTAVAIAQDELLESIKKTPNFALRLGRTNWRNKNWIINYAKLKLLLNKKISVDELTRWDIHPRIEQKAVDMKIGIDIALISLKKLADLLIIITGDADIVPALKLARREGMMVGLDPLRNPISDYLSEHVDFVETKV
jgi:uncharacterized LabA/DUF88 family protein